MRIKHLVLSGGGLKGISFLGTLEYLQRHRIISIGALETCAGSSAGALIAALIVIGYSVAEIFKLIYDCDIGSLAEPDVTQLLTKFGIESGYRVMSVFTEMFRIKGYKDNVTFVQLFERTQKRLVVTATCLGKGIKYFDHVSHPDFSVLLAIRMSISVPLIFTAVQHEGDYYVDGGVLDNVPIVALRDKPVAEVLTLSICDSDSSSSDETVEPLGFTGYLNLLIATIMKEMENVRREHQSYNRHHQASIFIQTGPHKISVDNDEKKELFRLGYLAAKRYVDSDTYLTLQIETLPHHVARKIWQYKHQTDYNKTEMLSRILDRLDRLVDEGLTEREIVDGLRALSALSSKTSASSSVSLSSTKDDSFTSEERVRTESIPSDYVISDDNDVFSFASSSPETILDELDKIDLDKLTDQEVASILKKARPKSPKEPTETTEPTEPKEEPKVKSRYPELEVLDIDWPNRDADSETGIAFDGYRKFMTELYAAFRSVGVKLGRPEQDMYCQEDPFNVGKYNPDALPIQQEIIPIYLHPSSPYNGLMLDHEVGTGKTRNAFRIIGQYKNIPDFRLIWVTSDKLRRTTPNQKDDFPAFHGTDSKENPFIKGASTSNHRKSEQIAIFSYVEFVNVVSGKNTRGYSNQLAARAKKYNGDPFANTLIVLDEAHKIFERTGSFGNGAYKDQDVYERIARHSYSTEYSDPTVKHCRWLILTATPAPTIEAPTNQKENKVEIAGGTFATLRLLNLLIDNPNRLLPVDDRDVATFNREYKGTDFANLVKGLVSYFKPTNWKNVFASVEGANDGLTKKPLTQAQTKRIRNIMKRSCSKYGKARDDKAKVSLAQCYLRRLHWYGNMLGPKMPEENKRRKVLGESTSPTRYPGGLDPYASGRELNVDNLPLGASLLSEIEVLDKLDLEKTGRKFKHLIFSNDKNHAAAAYAAMLTMPKTDGGLDFKYISTDDAEKAEPNMQGSDTLMFMHNDMEQKDSEVMQRLFNDHKRNANGELARIMVLGSGRKEGISLFDVKYVHMMEPQISETNKTQIIGRAVRRCGHTGLENEYRKVRVIVYGFDTDASNVIELKAPGLTSLGEIANAVMKQGEAFGEKLVARDKILRWMELTAIDAVDVPTTNEFEQKLNDIQLALNETDLMTANTLNQVEFVELGDARTKKMTIKALRAKCKELGLKGVAKINKTNFDDYYDLCVNQKALPQTLDENGELLTQEQLSLNDEPAARRVTGELIPPDFNVTNCDVEELKQICRDYKVKPIPTPKTLKAKKEKGLVPPDWTFKRELIEQCGKRVVPNEPFPARVAKRDLQKKPELVRPNKPLPPAPQAPRSPRSLSPPRHKKLPSLPLTAQSRSYQSVDIQKMIRDAIYRRYHSLNREELGKLTPKQVKSELETMFNRSLDQYKKEIKDELLRFIVRSRWSA